MGSNPTPSASYSIKYLIYIRYYILSNIAPHRAPHHGAIRCQVCLPELEPIGGILGIGHLADLDLPMRKHLRCASRWWGWTPPIWTGERPSARRYRIGFLFEIDFLGRVRRQII